MSQQKSRILHTLTLAAEWRDAKASQLSETERHVIAAAELRALYDSLTELPVDDPILIALAEEIEGADDLFFYREGEQQLIRSVGFGGSYAGNGRALVGDLLALAIKTIEPQKPSGAAALSENFLSGSESRSPRSARILLTPEEPMSKRSSARGPYASMIYGPRESIGRSRDRLTGLDKRPLPAIARRGHRRTGAEMRPSVCGHQTRPTPKKGVKDTR